MSVKKKSKPKLLATSPTRDGIESMVNKYFCSSTYKVSEDLKITRADGHVLESFRIVNVKRGFRFEDVLGSL